jgi:hypothetical protein
MNYKIKETTQQPLVLLFLLIIWHQAPNKLERISIRLYSSFKAGYKRIGKVLLDSLTITFYFTFQTNLDLG